VYGATVDPHVVPILVCPACQRAGSFTLGRTVRCPCGVAVDAGAGFLDLLATGSEPTAASSEQRLMESPVVARLYERVWRPTFVRVLAGRGAGASLAAILLGLTAALRRRRGRGRCTAPSL